MSLLREADSFRRAAVPIHPATIPASMTEPAPRPCSLDPAPWIARQPWRWLAAVYIGPATAAIARRLPRRAKRRNVA